MIIKRKTWHYYLREKGEFKVAKKYVFIHMLVKVVILMADGFLKCKFKEKHAGLNVNTDPNITQEDIDFIEEHASQYSIKFSDLYIKRTVQYEGTALIEDEEDCWIHEEACLPIRWFIPL